MINHLKILRTLAVLEGVSTLVLFGIAMPMKYLFNNPAAIRPVGMAHGILFIAYCMWVLIEARSSKWLLPKTAWALAASLVPFGTFVADYKLFKK
jgi:integral membrane protein